MVSDTGWVDFGHTGCFSEYLGISILEIILWEFGVDAMDGNNVDFDGVNDFYEFEE